MQKIFLTVFVLIAVQAGAQQQQGRVVYEQILKMRQLISGPGDPPPPKIPHERIEKVEVLFANGKSLRRQLEEETPTEFGGGEGVQIRMIGGPGADDISFYNFAEDRKVEQREFAAKQYLIIDSIQKQHWKLTGETKTILGFTCQQAQTTRISKRMEMNVDNGVMTRKQVPDTGYVVAWFTPAIPVPAGPDFQGQLPGLILQIDVNGNPQYRAIEVTEKVDVAAIKEPKKGKKCDTDTFNKERDKAIAEMERGGGMRRPMRGG